MATPELLLAVFDAGITAQAGTYEITGDKLTTRPLVAKNPGINPSSTVSCKLDGDTLTLTGQTNQFKLTRVE